MSKNHSSWYCDTINEIIALGKNNMYFNKCSTPSNFRFSEKNGKSLTSVKKECSFAIKDLGENVFQLNVKNIRWKKNYSQALLDKQCFKTKSDASFQLEKSGAFKLSLDGKELFSSKRDCAFGVNGQKWVMCFNSDKKSRYYGQGEKSNGLEKTGKKTKFWNTDVWADFHRDVYVNGRPDPMYVSVPYLLCKRPGGWLGILINNPFAVFMAIGAQEIIANQQGADQPDPLNYFGSEDGVPEVYFIAGKTVGEVTRKYQRLIGTTPIPPLWSLGNNQCRWGYESAKDLNWLDKNFTKHKIPADGLWLDIDYMDKFKVFTLDKKHFKEPKKEIQALRDKGRKIVPILDPGVKIEKGYPIYESGLKADIFCKTHEGDDFTGFVWPGATAFPDYSMPEAREWWANHVAKFAKLGFDGAWLDMNDPAVGSSELDEMLWNRGKDYHNTYHSQYGYGMAQASYEGFLKARPNQRPFLLARSGYISTSRFTAIWTGDNFSNFHHLQGCIAMSLNLALSGIPFNGPDVPGFGGDATGELARAWHKTGFLFPVFRNHALKNTKPQEPWSFDATTNKVMAEYIKSRYKVLPYLYNLFIDQAEVGEAILRPLFYEFNDAKLEKVDDQFMVGPAIMQAPVLEEGSSKRSVILPRGAWFDINAGKWLSGGKTISVTQETKTTPLFIRENSVIPMQTGIRTTNENDLAKIEAHVFINKTGKAKFVYQWDDGISFDYQKGKRSKVEFFLTTKGKDLFITYDDGDFSYSGIDIKFFVHGSFNKIYFHAGKDKVELKTSKGSLNIAGSKLEAVKTESVVLG